MEVDSDSSNTEPVVERDDVKMSDITNAAYDLYFHPPRFTKSAPSTIPNNWKDAVEELDETKNNYSEQAWYELTLRDQKYKLVFYKYHKVLEPSDDTDCVVIYFWYSTIIYVYLRNSLPSDKINKEKSCPKGREEEPLTSAYIDYEIGMRLLLKDGLDYALYLITTLERAFSNKLKLAGGISTAPCEDLDGSSYRTPEDL